MSEERRKEDGEMRAEGVLENSPSLIVSGKAFRIFCLFQQLSSLADWLLALSVMNVTVILWWACVPVSRPRRS